MNAPSFDEGAEYANPRSGAFADLINSESIRKTISGIHLVYT